MSPLFRGPAKAPVFAPRTNEVIIREAIKRLRVERVMAFLQCYFGEQPAETVACPLLPVVRVVLQLTSVPFGLPATVTLVPPLLPPPIGTETFTETPDNPLPRPPRPPANAAPALPAKMIEPIARVAVNRLRVDDDPVIASSCRMPGHSGYVEE
jgi:hypothetical protein